MIKFARKSIQASPGVVQRAMLSTSAVATKSSIRIAHKYPSESQPPPNYQQLSPLALIQSHVDAGASASFLVTNLATVRSMHTQWVQELPMVRPFYAVKCNPDPSILRLLASLGCGFDCATQGEIDLVINNLGKENNFCPAKATSSIIYAHPAKMTHMLRYAMDQKVGMTVFDGEDELYKIASMEGFRGIKVLLRLTTDDKSSVCPFSNKFGCPVKEAPALLKVAKSLDINVAGCSFHVGSGCGDAQAYITALNDCREVFQAADELDMSPLSIIDIGGGFPGDCGGYGGHGMPTFQELAKAIRLGINQFCDGGWTSRCVHDFQFIAEPGRYFVSASTTIASIIHSRKGGSSTQHQALYLDDGVYGSLNNVVYDHATPVPHLIVPSTSKSRGRNTSTLSDVLIPTAVFGPTCDGLDQICSTESTLLPRSEVGDWLVFDNCGAYTHTASFFFNGFTHTPTKLYCNYLVK
jgi:ornithine decarboxylase